MIIKKEKKHVKNDYGCAQGKCKMLYIHIFFDRKGTPLCA